MPAPPLNLTVAESLEQVTAAEWNALAGEDDPFIRHEFLAALERCGCVGERWGWLPRHLLLRDGDGRLIGAVPLYLKLNSYGELVFDWAWADAYRHAGKAYYPKLVSAIPYTPVTGARLLAPAGREEIRRRLIEGALELAREVGASSLHWLFPNPEDMRALGEASFFERNDCQFHWSNRGYRDFEDFLQALTAEKRKKVRRERRRVSDAGVGLKVLRGETVDGDLWALFHRFYADTFRRRGGHATLTPDFFQTLGRTMGQQLVLSVASKGGKPVAAALSYRSEKVLFGRHWGCEESFHSLHFETCYYAGIDYCIREGLERFEPGAGGEHKLARGFLPTLTRSAHWIADDDFARAIGCYVAEERAAVADYVREAGTHTPYRRSPDS